MNAKTISQKIFIDFDTSSERLTTYRMPGHEPFVASVYHSDDHDHVIFYPRDDSDEQIIADITVPDTLERREKSDALVRQLAAWIRP